MKSKESCLGPRMNEQQKVDKRISASMKPAEKSPKV
jgi:hypothetical protein